MVGTSPAQASTMSGSCRRRCWRSPRCDAPCEQCASASSNVQPLQFRLLAAGDHVDVIAAAQAVIENVEQAVGVGRIVNANHFAAALQRVVHKSGRLVAEPVVIVAPGVAGKEHVERSDRPAPGKVDALLQPFRVLRHHRVHHLRERFVGRPHPVPAGEQVALQPAFAADVR